MTASLDRHFQSDSPIVIPDRYHDLAHVPEGTLAVRGAGLSYVAASFDTHSTSIGMESFNRILSFNAADKTITVEAGLTLGKLHDFLAAHRLCLPVQPGYPALTIGGCVAADVHGKNHGRDGTFGRHVLDLKLIHPDHGTMTVCPSDPLFALTVGGFGLTGMIVAVSLRLVSIPGPAMVLDQIAFQSVEEGAQLLDRLSPSFDMAYAWLDLSNPGNAAGKGFITTAAWVQETDDAPAGIRPPILGRARPTPVPVFNRLSMPVINTLYRWNALRRGQTRASLESVLWPALGKETYFQFYGKAGFVESQVLIAQDRFADYVKAWRACQRKHQVPVMLATLKLFSGGQPSLLRYDGEGISFTIDVANTSDAMAFLAELDGLNVEYGARSCIIKDSRLSAAVVKAHYADYESFRDRLKEFDPQRRFVTALSRRLEL